MDEITRAIAVLKGDRAQGEGEGAKILKHGGISKLVN